MEWEIHISYRLKLYKLKSVLEYHSDQIMRIRVNGTKSSLLLENNYPLIRTTKSKKGIQWKIREGSLDAGTDKSSRLLLEILEQLEHSIKKDYPINGQ